MIFKNPNIEITFKDHLSDIVSYEFTSADVNTNTLVGQYPICDISQSLIRLLDIDEATPNGFPQQDSESIQEETLSYFEV